MSALTPVAGAPVASVLVGSASTTYQLTQIGVEPWTVKLGEMRVTQTGVEPWLNHTGEMRLSQVGMELWTVNSSLTRYMALSQVGVEAWIFLPHDARPPFFWFFT